MAKKSKRSFHRLDTDDLARLTILGAAGEVTGSCFLLETAALRLLVDCGMFQGPRSRERNGRRFPYDPAGIDAVVLTHAHIDHSGLLPKLARDGFRGKIHATQATGELVSILLRDSAHIHEQDTLHENRRRLRAGRRPLEPLYRMADAERALDALELHPFDVEFELAPGLSVRFARAGHILGAASVECWIREGSFVRKIVFSGDVGRRHEPILRPPEPPRDADLVLLESTYGDRDHRSYSATVDELAGALRQAVSAGSNVIMPVFAVGRAQEILHTIAELERAGRIPELAVFLDSPMAIHASELYRGNPDCFQRAAAGATFELLEPRRLALCRTPEESASLNERRGIVILSASGMCEGGRVLHHLRHHLWREATDVVIVGFQAHGTLGRALVEGARSVRIFGERVVVRARIVTLGGFSAHAGQSELLEWVASMLQSGARVALIHGEEQKRSALAAQLARFSPSTVWLPARGDVIRLKKRGEPVVLADRGAPASY